MVTLISKLRVHYYSIYPTSQLFYYKNLVVIFSIGILGVLRGLLLGYIFGQPVTGGGIFKLLAVCLFGQIESFGRLGLRAATTK